MGLALGPGILVTVYFFGPGVMYNIALSLLFGLIFELIMYRLKGRPLRTFPMEGSGAIMAILFALSLPPTIAWWMLLIGIGFAVVLGKYIYGGLGNNVFNPAMVGVVVLLVSFPREMSQWQLMIDGQTGATPLDTLQTGLRLSQTLSELQNARVYGQFGASQVEWINLAFLIGGLGLIQQKIIRWQIPVGVLTGLFVIALLFHIIDADRYPAVLFHLFGGVTMLGAFFIATDPVTSPITAKGRFIYGLLIGIIIYLIRTFGSYPEGVAFAVLMMNAAVPVLDHYTRPRAPA